MCAHITYIYIYKYIYTERERENERVCVCVGEKQWVCVKEREGHVQRAAWACTSTYSLHPECLVCVWDTQTHVHIHTEHHVYRTNTHMYKLTQNITCTEQTHVHAHTEHPGYSAYDQVLYIYIIYIYIYIYIEHRARASSRARCQWPSLSLTHAYSLSLTHTHSPSRSFSSLSLSLSHTQEYPRYSEYFVVHAQAARCTWPSLSFAHTHPLSLSHTHTHSFSLSLFSLSHPHTLRTSWIQWIRWSTCSDSSLIVTLFFLFQTHFLSYTHTHTRTQDILDTGLLLVTLCFLFHTHSLLHTHTHTLTGHPGYGKHVEVYAQAACCTWPCLRQDCCAPPQGV